MTLYPLLDMDDAHRGADEALGDLAWEIERLQINSGGHYPPDSAPLLEDIAALRLMLGSLFSPALKHAIAEERKLMDDEAARWEPSSY